MNAVDEAREKDEYIRLLPLAGGFIDVGNEFISHQFKNFKKYQYRLETDGYIGTTKGGTNDNFTLKAWSTAKGRDFIREGGYTAQVYKVVNDQKILQEKEVWEKETKKKELRNSQTANLISGLAFLTSVFTFFWAIRESNSNDINQKQILSKMDSLSNETNLLKKDYILLDSTFKHKNSIIESKNK